MAMLRRPVDDVPLSTVILDERHGRSGGSGGCGARHYAPVAGTGRQDWQSVLAPAAEWVRGRGTYRASASRHACVARSGHGWQAGPVAKPPVMRPTSADVGAFLDAVPNETRRGDAKVLCKLLGEVTGEPPVLWGPSIVGFGTLHYRYESGREGSMPLAGFSPRKAHLVVNLINGFEARDHQLMAKLGSCRTGVSKLYIKTLADIDLNILRDLVERSVRISRDADRAARLMRPP
jgi:hypothetical protein